MINKLLRYIIHYIPENNRAERLWKLAQIDFKKRYYNDKLGLFWALINPILRVTVYYIVFTKIFPRAREGIEHFALFIFCGLIFWQHFTQTAMKCLGILRSKKYLIENIAAPKVDLYLSAGLSTLLGFSFNVFAYCIVALIVGVKYSLPLLFLPFLMLNVTAIALGVGMIISVISIYLRDINHVMDIIFLFGFWGSGIFYSGERILNMFPAYKYFNPFLGIIMNARNVLLNNATLNIEFVIIGLVYAVVTCIVGFFVLKRYSHLAMEKL